MARNRLLGSCLLVSGLVHAGVLIVGGVQPQRPGSLAQASLNVQLRPLAQSSGHSLGPGSERPAAIGPDKPPSTKVASGAGLPVQSAHPGRAQGLIQHAPREDEERLPLAWFDPDLYLTPRQVDRGPLPVKQDLLGSLALSGFEPGQWRVRVFVDEAGNVDEVEMVEERGSRRNAEEIKATLLASRFQPGLSNTTPVKSQTMYEIRFEPDVVLRALHRAPGPSAAGM